MQTVRSIDQASEIFKGRWLKVQIHAPTYALTHLCVGYIYCLEGRRLLDHLNDVFPSTLPEEKAFLSIKEVEMYSLKGAPEKAGAERKTAQFACLNKANILFVREFEDRQTRGIGGKAGCKGYPYVLKSSVPVKLHLPFYVLTGHMHCAKEERVSDVLNLALRFLPLTNVEICPSVGGCESGISFVAVNKHQIILVEDLQTAGMKVPAPSDASELPR